jgi:hypothetical protein
MFLSICKWGIISFTLIFLIHYLYMFFINTLTIPKIKDLVNKPNEQYRDIFETLQKTHPHPQTQQLSTPTDTDTKQMTEELSSFLNDLKKNPQGFPKSEDNLLSANEMTGGGFSSY